MHQVDWTSVLVALIAMIGSTLSAFFAFVARRGARRSTSAAARAEEKVNSLSPPPESLRVRDTPRDPYW